MIGLEVPARSGGARAKFVMFCDGPLLPGRCPHGTTFVEENGMVWRVHWPWYARLWWWVTGQ